MSARELSQMIGDRRTQLRTAVTNLTPLAKNEEHKQALETAKLHLDAVDMHHAKALHKPSGGIGSNNPDTGMVAQSLQNASRSLTQAHNTIKNAGVHLAAGSQHTVSLPEDQHIADISARAKSLQPAKGPKPFPEIPFGGATLQNIEGTRGFKIKSKNKNLDGKVVSAKDISELAKKTGQSQPGVQKLRAASQGTPKGKTAGIAGKKSLKEGEQRGNRSGVVGGKGLDPRRPASSKNIRSTYQGSDYKKVSQNPLMMPENPTKSQAKGKGLPNVRKKK